MKNAISKPIGLRDMYGAVACAPFVTSDFSGLTPELLPLVILALMSRGLRDAGAIGDFLLRHGAPLDWQDILDVLSEKSSPYHKRNGMIAGLWRTDGCGRFEPHVIVEH